MLPKRTEWAAVIQTAVETLGLTLFGIEFAQGSSVRVYIDKPGGVTVQDCVAATSQIRTLLRVQLPHVAEMALEVSSPGLDRRLFTPAQAMASLGAEVQLRLKMPEEGQRQLKGQLTAATDTQIEVTTPERVWSMAWDAIEWMRIIPQI